MKNNVRGLSAIQQLCRIAIILSFILAANTIATTAQTTPEPETIQNRLARARALAAAHNLTAAVFELDAIRNSTTDGSVRDVARIMLVGIYLEQGDYPRAQNLLEETFNARVVQDEASTRSYFVVAGQAVNGIRAHLDRYRAYGLNVTDKDLPADAVNDLDRLRILLERIAAQSKEIGTADMKNTDAFALLEDVATVRTNLARNERERAEWQMATAEARQSLAAAETRMATTPTMVAISSPAPSAAININSPRSTSTVSPDSSPAVAGKGPARVPADANGDAAAGASKKAVETTNTATTAPGQPISVGSLIEKATQKVSPRYPPFAKTARVTGVVTVELLIDETGEVSTVQVASGPEMLRQAALDAARRWRFRPTVIDGQPVRVTGYLSFNFTL